METFGIASVAAISLICYAIGMIIKSTDALDNKYIPAIVLVVGAVELDPFSGAGVGSADTAAAPQPQSRASTRMPRMIGRMAFFIRDSLCFV